jgi:hypothetical protein
MQPLTTDQEKARALLVTVFGTASGNAADRVLALDDDEAAAIAAAAPTSPTDRARAFAEIRALVSKADERRGADEGRAGKPIAATTTARNHARYLLHVHFGLSADEAAAAECVLAPEHRQALSDLASSHDGPVSTDAVRAIVGDLTAASQVDRAAEPPPLSEVAREQLAALRNQNESLERQIRDEIRAGASAATDVPTAASLDTSAATDASDTSAVETLADTQPVPAAIAEQFAADVMEAGDDRS